MIDSPGVREFGLWHLEPEQIFNGFVEFHDYLGACKYRDCKHDNDPGCAIAKRWRTVKLRKPVSKITTVFSKAWTVKRVKTFLILITDN